MSDAPALSAPPIARLVVDDGKRQPPPQASAASAGRSVTDGVGVFIELEMEARECQDLDKLRFAMTNSIRKLTAFDRAFLAEPTPDRGWTITCASSVHSIDRHAPLMRFMQQWLQQVAHAAGVNAKEARFANLQADANQFAMTEAVPAILHAFWLPIKARDGSLMGSLILLKSEPWRPQLIALLVPLSAGYGHAWEALKPKQAPGARSLLAFASKRRIALLCAALAAAAAFIPVPMSSLAPAEIVARSPALVTAPIDGVIADIKYAPGTMVENGAPLLQFVDVNLRNAHEVASRKRDVAHARYFKVVQTATANQKEIEEIAISKAELDVAESELAYAQEMLSHTVLKSTGPGLLIYSGKSDWIGRPVVTGERIMEIGRPGETEIRIEMPVSDAITLNEASPVALFLDGDPLNSIPATVTRINYRPAPNGENQLIYRVHASMAEGVAHRIGLRGVARVSSGHVSLAFYLFRRPIAALRQRFGL